MADPEPRPAADSSGLGRTRDLTTGSIPRHLIVFAAPMLMGSVLQTLYSIVNALWVGNGLGDDAMAAVTVSLPVFFVLMAAANGLTLGSNVLAAQYFGARDWSQVRRVVRNSVVLIGAVSVLLAVAGHLATNWLLTVMDTPRSILPSAAAYLRVFVWSLPAMFGLFLIAALLRAAGDSRTPLYFQASALLATAVLDPILMFGWLGFPRMGLVGTAVAAMTCQTVGLVAICIYLTKQRHMMAPPWRELRADWEMTGLTAKIGLPSMVQQALMSIGLVVIMRIVNGFGSSATTAFGISMRLDNVAFMPALTIGMAISSLAGQNIGAGLIRRVREIFKWGLVVSWSVTAVTALIVVLGGRHLVGAFSRDPQIVAMGARYLQVVGGAYLPLAAMFVSNGIINGAGHTLTSTAISIVSLWGIRVPLAHYLSSQPGIGVEGVWWAMASGFVVGMVLSLSYYASGRWRKPVGIRKMGIVQAVSAASGTVPDPACDECAAVAE